MDAERTAGAGGREGAERVARAALGNLWGIYLDLKHL